jgi:tryptophan synthase beta chain
MTDGEKPARSPRLKGATSRAKATGRTRKVAGAAPGDVRDPAEVPAGALGVSLPDHRGRFGWFGGRYVPEVLIPALDELDAARRELAADDAFGTELNGLLRDFVGRPTPLTHAAKLSEELGYRIWLKREDLAHTGAHKINNCVGQVLLAKRMGKRRIIAETGAGQHGVATAAACALMGLPCVVYMGEEDTRRQAVNVDRMRLLGAEVKPVKSGSRTLKDAINEALRDWAATVEETHYVVGSVVGPHPFPALVRDFQRVIGDEAKRQYSDAAGGRPDVVAACVGGGSNAIGMFTAFVGSGSRLTGIEAGGRGTGLGEHCATLGSGTTGVLHGTRSFLLQDAHGQIADTHSISAGLDYPCVGPEHAWLKEEGLATYAAATDREAVLGFLALSRLEGILPALEPAHVIGWLLSRPVPEGTSVLVNLSGRGDKDLDTVMAWLDENGPSPGEGEAA